MSFIKTWGLAPQMMVEAAIEFLVESQMAGSERDGQRLREESKLCSRCLTWGRRACGAYLDPRMRVLGSVSSQGVTKKEWRQARKNDWKWHWGRTSET